MTDKDDTAAAATAQAHTPGPWKFSGDDIMSAVDAEDFEAFGAVAFLTLPNHQANARFIAAAPDMLEALRQIESTNDGSLIERNSKMKRIARAAIAKAEGRKDD